MAASKRSNSTSGGTNRPVMNVNVGGIRAAVWANQNSDGRMYHTVTVTKSYQDDSGNWHEVTNFGRDDLPKVELVTRKAFEFIHLKADVDRSEMSHVERLSQSEGAELGT